nr:MAG TPA: hypothetical protein [Caudoviricetes sp.]DAM18154.1 MAG TPA: hypothetical protein [Caudoviricetes sp.]DAZ20686.1 MAG TPA: hypothetical protein [Caudoviricetes sp.]
MQKISENGILVLSNELYQTQKSPFRGGGFFI